MAAPTADTGIVQLSQTDTTVLLNGGDITVTLNKANGQIASLRNAMSDPLSFGNGPLLVSGTGEVSGLKVYSEGTAQVAEFSYTGNMQYAKWKMHSSGWLSLEYAYTLNGTYPFAGISFTYPENFVLGAKWLGKGPYRVWKNRLQGVTDNVWKNAYNNTYDFFSKSGNWYSTSYAGLSLKIPIFSGFSKDANLKKARLQANQLDNQIEDLKRNIENEVRQSRNNFFSAIRTMDNQKQNTALAESVYDQTKKKFESGLASNTDLTNAQTDLIEAQTNYVNALYNAVIAKIDYLKAIGKI